MGNGLSRVNLLLKIKPEGNEAETGIKIGGAYPDKMVVFEATVHFKNLLAGELSESPFDTIYRAHRISIYP